MRRTIVIASILLGLAVPAVQARQIVEFDLSRLSERGRSAYSVLQTALIFRIGPVGFAGQTSAEELALQNLMYEGEAIDAFKSLCRNATTAGSLYALLALSIRDVTAFRDEVQFYRDHSEENRHRSEDLAKSSQQFPELAAAPGKVPTQRGCVVMPEQIESVLRGIELGTYRPFAN